MEVIVQKTNTIIEIQKKNLENKITIEKPGLNLELTKMTDAQTLQGKKSTDFVPIQAYPICIPKPRMSGLYPVFPYTTSFVYKETPSGILYAIPVYIPQKIKLKTVAIGVTTAASSGTDSFKVGFYLDTNEKLGEYSFSGLFTTGEKTASGNITLPAGLVWYTYLSLCNATLRATSFLNTLMFGFCSTLLDSTVVRTYYANGYSTLPETLPQNFPTGSASWSTVVLKLVDYEI